MKMTRQPLSLDQPVGDHDDSFFGEFLARPPRRRPAVRHATSRPSRAGSTRPCRALNYREREILRLRYGLADGYAYTLEEVGKIFSVTRERVRQIETKAVRKLQQPYRCRSLASFIDGLEIPLDATRRRRNRGETASTTYCAAGSSTGGARPVSTSI